MTKHEKELLIAYIELVHNLTMQLVSPEPTTKKTAKEQSQMMKKELEIRKRIAKLEAKIIEEESK